MLVDVYQSLFDPAEFVTVLAGKHLAAITLPVGNVYQDLHQFALGVDLIAEPRAGFSSPQINLDIHHNGFALHHVLEPAHRVPQPA